MCNKVISLSNKFVQGTVCRCLAVFGREERSVPSVLFSQATAVSALHKKAFIAALAFKARLSALFLFLFVCIKCLP